MFARVRRQAAAGRRHAARPRRSPPRSCAHRARPGRDRRRAAGRAAAGAAFSSAFSDERERDASAAASAAQEIAERDLLGAQTSKRSAPPPARRDWRRRRGPRWPASGRRPRARASRDAHDDLVAVELLQARCAGAPRVGVVDVRVEQLLDRARRRVATAKPARRSTPSGSRSGTIADAQHDAVRDHDVVVAVREGRVEQAERADDALGLPGEAAGLQAHAVADAERPRAEQHDAGDQVAERLLGRETEDDRGEGAADGQRPRVQARRPAARRSPR